MIRKFNGIVKAITEDILSGAYVPLGPIPGERVLMERFGAARETVRKALDELERQGMIYRRPGRATVVSDHILGAKTKIGVMISGCTYTEIFRAVCDTVGRIAERDQVEVVIGDASRRDSDHSGDAAAKIANDMVRRGIRGVILQPLQFSRTADEINLELVRIFSSAGVKVVLIDCDVVRIPERSEYDVVGIDNVAAGRIAAEHAVAQGAKRIAFLARRGCADTVHERWIGVRGVSDRVAVEGRYLDSFSDYDHVRRTLAGMPSVDAIICQNDIAAMNVMTVLRMMGRRIPEDVMLIGFDDVVMAAKTRPGLTSVRQPCEDIAEQAYRRLLWRLDNPTRPPVRIQCREQLVVRASTERKWR